FITRLVRAGVKPKEAQALARHSTITLTMDRYAHTGLHDVARAVESLPSLATDPPERARRALKATGTEGCAGLFQANQLAPVCTGFARTDDSGRSSVIPRETKEGQVDDAVTEPENCCKSPTLLAVATERGSLTLNERSGEGGIL